MIWPIIKEKVSVVAVEVIDLVNIATVVAAAEVLLVVVADAAVTVEVREEARKLKKQWLYSWL